MVIQLIDGKTGGMLTKLDNRKSYIKEGIIRYVPEKIDLFGYGIPEFHFKKLNNMNAFNSIEIIEDAIKDVCYENDKYILEELLEWAKSYKDNEYAYWSVG